MRKESEDIFSQRKIDVIHSAYIVHTLYQQQKLGKYCDLKVLVGDKQYFVHRCILAAASAQLDSQINGLDTIQLVGVTYYGFECLLEILYSGKLRDISSLSDSKFQQIVSAADALNAEIVMEYCTRERGDLMNLLLSQSSAAGPANPNEVASEVSSEKLNSQEQSEKQMSESQTSTKSETRPFKNDGELQAPVAAEVEVVSVQKQDDGASEAVAQVDTGVPANSGVPTLPLAEPRIVEVDAAQNKDVPPGEDYERETGMTCNVCGAVFLNTSDLKVHMHTHIGEKLFRCEICGLHFKFEMALVNHKKLHCTCQICGMEMSTVADLRLHQELHHKDAHPIQMPRPSMDDQSVSPKGGGKAAKRKSGVTPSMARNKAAGKAAILNPVIVNDIMRGENGKYQCPLCERGFDRRWNLKCHILIHTSGDKTKKPVTEARYIEAVFTCPECGKLFRNLHNLRRHASAVHGMTATDLDEASESPSGEYSVTPKKVAKKEPHDQSVEEYKFWCSICGRGFKRNRNLRGHMEAHQSQGVAKYECPVCHRKFAQKESLNGHLWIHKNKPEEVKPEFN